MDPAFSSRRGGSTKQDPPYAVEIICLDPAYAVEIKSIQAGVGSCPGVLLLDRADHFRSAG